MNMSDPPCILYYFSGTRVTQRFNTLYDFFIALVRSCCRVYTAYLLCNAYIIICEYAHNKNMSCTFVIYFIYT